MQMVPRYKFVKQHMDSPELDIGVSEVLDMSYFQNIGIFRVVMGAHVRYKVIIVLQGNDVLSGLKWALYSRSLVLMPPQTMTSCLMEELLKTWGHYIPLNPQLSNVREMMKWVSEQEGLLNAQPCSSTIYFITTMQYV